VRAKSAHCTLFENRGYTRTLQFGGFLLWHPNCGNGLSAGPHKLIDSNKRSTAMSRYMSTPENEVRTSASEYLTVPELAKMVRRNRKTVYGWIATGEIGEADGLFVVQGRFLIHWPTFRAKQFKPLEKLRGQVPDFSEETENGVARNGQTRSITDRV
jgi:hypothetical protein